MSLDGRLDDASPDRLLLSNEVDFDRADEVRASCDAIFVGAQTVRNDDPRLLVRSPQRIQHRTQTGRSDQPVKVTWTQTGRLCGDRQFFTAGNSQKIVYCPIPLLADLQQSLPADTKIVALERLTPDGLLSSLSEFGIHRLLVEGGSQTNTQFLSADLVDELHLSIAPFFVGEQGAPRFVNDAKFPTNVHEPWILESAEMLEQVVELRYRRGTSKK